LASGSSARRQPRTKLCAVTGSPSLKTVSVRSRNVQVVAVGSDSHSRAVAGISPPSSSSASSPVNRALQTRMPSPSWALYGSMAVGSVMPIRKITRRP